MISSVMKETHERKAFLVDNAMKIVLFTIQYLTFNSDNVFGIRWFGDFCNDYQQNSVKKFYLRLRNCDLMGEMLNVEYQIITL